MVKIDVLQQSFHIPLTAVILSLDAAISIEKNAFDFKVKMRVDPKERGRSGVVGGRRHPPSTIYFIKGACELCVVV